MSDSVTILNRMWNLQMANRNLGNRSRPCVVRTLLDIKHLIACALLLADGIEPYCGVDDSGRMDWQYLFDLARRIKTEIVNSGTDPNEICMRQLRPVVNAFRLRIIELEKTWEMVDFDDEEGCWVIFLDGWSKIKHLEGESPLQRAYRLAKESPIQLVNDFDSERVRELASTAYHLQLINGNAPIMLPVENVGALFGGKAIDGSRLRSLIEEPGLIVKTKQYVPKRHADEFRFAMERTDLYQPPE